MAGDRPWTVGLQLFAYDVNDEGADQVIRGAILAAARVLLLCVSYSDDVMEIHPGSGGALVHNPRRQWHANEAYFAPTLSRYPRGLVPPRSGAEGLDSEAAYRDLRPLAERNGMEVVPWVLLMSQRVANQAPASAVINVRGERVPGWLCPNRPEVIAFAQALIADVIQKFEPKAVFIDRIRFPDWGPRGAADACSCFCDICQAEATAFGVDVRAVRAQLTALLESIESDPASAALQGIATFRTGFRTLRAAAGTRPILGWFESRHRAVERLVRAVREVTGNNVELWLDVWPPSSGWLLGQDLSRLAQYGVWTKPFTYHRWGGGSDVPGFIASTSRDPYARQLLYDAFRAFFGFSGPQLFDEFAARGLDPSFITTETLYARELLGNRSKLAAGLQAWGLGRKGMQLALNQAELAQPDGVFFCSYGWAAFEELEAAGDWLRERGHVAL